jgi:hypothetical protein
MSKDKVKTGRVLVRLRRQCELELTGSRVVTLNGREQRSCVKMDSTIHIVRQACQRIRRLPRLMERDVRFGVFDQ